MKNSGPTLKAYWHALSGFDPRLVKQAAVLMFTGALLEGIGLMMLIPLLGAVGLADGGTAQGNYGPWLDRLPFELSLRNILLLFVALVVLQSLIIRQRELSTNRLRLRFIDHLRTGLFDSLIHANWRFFVERHTTEVIHTIGSDMVRIGTGTYHLLQFGVSAVLALVYLLVAARMSLAMTALALLLGATLWLLLRRQNRNALRSGVSLSQASERMHRCMQEFLGSIKIAKSHSAEAAHLQTFHATLQTLQAQQMHFVRDRSTTTVVYRVGAAAAVCLLVYIAVAHLNLATEPLLVLILIFARLMPMLAGVQQQYQHVLHMLPAFASYQDLMAATATAKEQGAAAKVELAPLTQALRFDGVSYAYHATLPVLRDVSASIPAQRTIALVGRSGSGKTTFVDLATGLLTPQHGRVLIDGAPLTPALRRAWHAQLAYVPQDVTLFNDTLRRNLGWLNPAADDAAMWQALEQASAGFVRAWPEGLDTTVGEHGLRLSGGERQRIALARALLRQPRVLILDEATSALDSEHERAIHATLERLHGNLTIIIIAHRLSTVRHADSILVFEAGRIAEQGGWEALMASKGGVLRRLHDAELVTPNQVR